MTIEQSFLAACQEGDFWSVKQLVYMGAANIQDRIQIALSWTCYYGHFEMLKYLVEQGANLHGLNEQDLIWTKSHGNVEMVEFIKKVKIREKLRQIS